MKRLLSILLSICFIVGALYGCGDRNSTEDKLEFEQLEWPSYNNAKQIPVPKSSMADVRNCNDVRFEFYLANTTLEDFKAYVEECKAKGFVVDAVEQDDRYFAYNEENYELTVSHQEGSIMYVCVVEKRLDVEIKLLHTDNASADLYNLRIEIDGYWEADSEKGDGVITFDTYLREGKHTLIISNDDDGTVRGRLDFTVSSDGEYFEFNIHCMSDKIQINQANSIATVDTNADDNETGDSNIKSTESNENETIETLSSTEADSIFESIFNCLGNAAKSRDLSDVFDFSFDMTIDDVIAYEAEKYGNTEYEREILSDKIRLDFEKYSYDDWKHRYFFDQENGLLTSVSYSGVIITFGDKDEAECEHVRPLKKELLNEIGEWDEKPTGDSVRSVAYGQIDGVPCKILYFDGATQEIYISITEK